MGFVGGCEPWAVVLACALAWGDPSPSGVGDPYYPDYGNGGMDVLRYDLDFTIEPSDNALRGVVSLRMRALQELPLFHLDLIGMDVDAIEVEGVDASFTREARELVITPARAIPADAEVDVVVRYHGEPEGVPDPAVPIEGVGWFWHGDSIWVLSEPGGSAGFFPCNDHPSDKAAYTFDLTVAAPYVAVANGTLTATTESERGVTYSWSAPEPMATYLVTLAVGELGEKRIPMADGREVVLHFPKDAPEKRYAALERSGEIVTFLETKFGPYPFATIGGVLSSLPIGAALETQGRPVYGQSAGASESTVAHELAHQWFGNSVTVARWQDIWVSEGFAEYGSWLWSEHAHGRAAYDREVAGARTFAKRARSRPSGDPGVKQMFGVPSYQRGPLVLHELRESLGDEAFFALLRAWHEAKKYSNATVDEFVEFAAARSPHEAATRALLRAWLFDTVMPGN
ncbi:MAG: M1 family metallopeptidase [Planctomycetes bacterium]|nr:M1 family metallopeptidase [Planctomycetota bacterium]MCC7171041.1 M1 family metallopeptidase [Planctomycetota bacterium]